MRRAATRPAAVLVAVVEHPEPTVLLTQRTADLASHAGQIAFPGGKIDPHDARPLAAAMREGEEEIGLERQLLDPIGYLDLYLTFSGFRILPALVRVDPDYTLTVNPSEVAEAFEVPLTFLMEPTNHASEDREWSGIQRTYWRCRTGTATSGGSRRGFCEICTSGYIRREVDRGRRPGSIAALLSIFSPSAGVRE